MTTSFQTYAIRANGGHAVDRGLGAGVDVVAMRKAGRGLETLRVNDFALATRCVR